MGTDGVTLIIVFIFGLVLGFLAYPEYTKFKKRLREFFSFATRNKAPKPKLKKPTLGRRVSPIKVIGKYTIDDFEFTVIEKPGIEDYDRDAYNPGTTTRLNGEWSPREQVLIRDSLVQVTVDQQRGKIIGGQWKCPYTGKVFTDPRDIDIDHIVPLAEAWICGAKMWSQPQRSAFSRDLENLIPVSSEANREKGRCAPDKWMPDMQEARLWYIQRWLHTKKKYDLGVSVLEVQAMAKFAQ